MAAAPQPASLPALQLEARLDELEARVVELEGLLAAGTATAADRDELTRLQAEADFCFEVLEDMAAFGSRASD